MGNFEGQDIPESVYHKKCVMTAKRAIWRPRQIRDGKLRRFTDVVVQAWDKHNDYNRSRRDSNSSSLNC